MSRLSEVGGQSFVARLYANMLTGIREGGVRTRITDLASEEAQEQVQAVFWDRANDVPAHCFVWSTTERFVLIDGTSQQSQANRLMRGYGASVTGPYEFPVNQFLVDCAATINAHVGSIPIPPMNVVTIAGYSLGGAIGCHMLKARQTNLWQGNGPQVITFGAPRPANRNDCFDMRAQGAIWRYFCHTDPVPLIPVHPDESTAFAIYAGRFNSINYGRFVHPVDGIQVDLTGAFSRQQTASEAPTPPFGDMIAWYLGYALQTPNGHTLETFIDRVQPTLRAGREFVLPNAGPVERIGEHTMRQQSAQERRTTNAVLTAEREQQAVPLNIPNDRACVARRIGRVWGVYFRDALIVVRPGKKTARHIARSFNELLDRLQTSAVVQPQAIVQTLTEYLNDASDPASAFTPTMRVSIPE